MFAAIALLSIFVFLSSAATTTTTIESVDNEMQPIIDKLAARTRFTKQQLQQISVVFKSAFPNGITAEFLAEQFMTMQPTVDHNAALGAMTLFVNAMDTDNDGSVSFEEFIDFGSIWMHGNNRQKYESVFRVGDANRNGYMTEAEVFAVAKLVADMTPSARPISISQLRTQIRNDFKQYDVDGDGNVSLMEFLDKEEHSTENAELLKKLENEVKEMINAFLPVVRYMY